MYYNYQLVDLLMFQNVKIQDFKFYIKHINIIKKISLD